MEFKECLAEASREGGGGLGDAAFGAGELGGEAAEEVVLGLLGGEDRNGGEHTECVGAEEDYVLGGGTVRDGLNDLLDVVDGIAYAGVLGHALVGEVDFAFCVDGHVLEEGVAADGVVDVGLTVLVEVDDLGVATAFEVEDAVVVPAVFVVTDEETLGVGREGGLAGAGEAEEDGGVLAVHVGVGRAVHGGDALEGEVVVHHREHTFLHFAAVPGVDDDLFARGDVEYNGGFGVEAEFLVVGEFGLGSVVNDEVRGEVGEFFSSGADEHVGHEVGLPCYFHDEADSHAGVFVGAAEAVDNEEFLAGEFFNGEFLACFPSLFGCGLVVVLVFFGCPPNGVF